MDQKLLKYNTKLANTRDQNKIDLYNKKINYYKSMCINVNEEGLQKPRPFSLNDYRLDVNDPQSIKAIGFGTQRRDFPVELMDFERRAPRNEDVVIEIFFCGICHTDWHVLLNEWKNTKYPMICGHEITGKVAKIGNSVTKFRVGDNVALGPNYNSCRTCKQCQMHHEQYCLNDVTETYNMPDYKPGELKPTGPITYGGYSNVIVAPEHFLIKLPDNAPLDRVAPLLCAGITMYTPLKYCDIKSGDRVGIAGIGGLGHLGIKLAKSFGAEVFALTQTPDKLDDAINLGADHAILVKDNDALRAVEASFDLVIDTIPFNHDLFPYLNLIKPNKTLWIVGSFFTMAVDFELVNRKGRIIRGSSTGNISDTQECVDYCIQNNIYPNIIKIQANADEINATHRKLLLSEVKYRYVIDLKTI